MRDIPDITERHDSVWRDQFYPKEQQTKHEHVLHVFAPVGSDYGFTWFSYGDLQAKYERVWKVCMSVDCSIVTDDALEEYLYQRAKFFDTIEPKITFYDTAKDEIFELDWSER